MSTLEVKKKTHPHQDRRTEIPAGVEQYGRLSCFCSAAAFQL